MNMRCFSSPLAIKVWLFENLNVWFEYFDVLPVWVGVSKVLWSLDVQEAEELDPANYTLFLFEYNQITNLLNDRGTSSLPKMPIITICIGYSHIRFKIPINFGSRTIFKDLTLIFYQTDSSDIIKIIKNVSFKTVKYIPFELSCNCLDALTELDIMMGSKHENLTCSKVSSLLMLILMVLCKKRKLVFYDFNIIKM